MAESQLPDWVGSQVGRYSVTGLIGRGGMGLVLRGQDAELQRPVAIKVLYSHLCADANLVERFHREAQTAANLRHPHIVVVYDVGREKDCPYIVMELLEGQPLSQVVAERGALPPPEAVAIAAQMASALDLIHQQGLVHRDVKATNIIVSPAGRAVLTDFGLVETPTGRKLTVQGTILGTPQYLAPEQLARGKVGPWTDLYALGVVVYEMLSGQVPFDADTPSGLLFQVLWLPPPPICLPGSGLPNGMDKVLGRVLAKQPEDRYPDGAAFVAALEQALPGSGGERLAAVSSQDGAVARAASSAAVLPAAGPVALRRRPAGPRPVRAVWSAPTWLWGMLCGIVVLLTVGVLLSLGGLVSFLPAAWTATLPPPSPSAGRPAAALSPALAEGTAPGTTHPSALAATTPGKAFVPSPFAGQVRIVRVYNEGKKEHVTLANGTGGDLDLSGWSVSGSLGKERFTFPDGYVLPAGQSVNLYSGEGGVAHPPGDIVWTAKNVWNNAGETVYLWDEAGNIVDEYAYP